MDPETTVEMDTTVKMESEPTSEKTTTVNTEPETPVQAAATVKIEPESTVEITTIVNGEPNVLKTPKPEPEEELPPHPPSNPLDDLFSSLDETISRVAEGRKEEVLSSIDESINCVVASVIAMEQPKQQELIIPAEALEQKPTIVTVSAHDAAAQSTSALTEIVTETQDVKPEVYCFCKSSDIKRFMIACEKCDIWFHGDCVKVTKKEGGAIEKWYCSSCITSDPNLKIIYKTITTAAPVEKKKSAEETGNRCVDTNPVGCIHCFRAKNCKECTPEKWAECPHFPCLVVRKEEPAKDFLPEKRKRGRKRKPLDSDDDDDDQIYMGRSKYDPKEVRARALVEVNIATEKKIAARRPRKRENTPHQCLGPECILTARENSKYCSDDCGMRLAEARIKHAKKQSVRYWKQPRQFTEGIRQGKKLEVQIEASFVRAKELVDRMVLVQRWVNAVKAIDPVDSDDENEVDNEAEKGSISYFCPVCAADVGEKALPKHIERCFVKQEKQSELGSSQEMKEQNPDNLFCDALNKTSNTYCKRLRVMCADHYKGELEKELKICGFPLAWNNQKDSAVFDEVYNIFDNIERTLGLGFCQKAKKNCQQHHRWVQITLGLLECERYHVLLRLDEQMERKRMLLNSLSTMGDILTLLGMGPEEEEKKEEVVAAPVPKQEPVDEEAKIED
ncbi:unnamed protein product, partial [Mesorhabditis spiculigera]